MGEFELIRRYFLPLAGRRESGSLILGPGDDCAIQRIPAGRDLVFSVDALVRVFTFPETTVPIIWAGEHLPPLPAILLPWVPTRNVSRLH